MDVVFAHWSEVLMPTAKRTEKRLTRIKARLKEGFTVEQLCKAIDGATKDDFLMGRDPKARPGGWRGLETVLRDAAQVERLMALDDEMDDFEWTQPPPHDEDPPGTVYGPPPADFLEALKSFGEAQERFK